MGGQTRGQAGKGNKRLLKDGKREHSLLDATDCMPRKSAKRGEAFQINKE